MNKIKNISLVLIFVSIVFSISLASSLKTDAEYSNSERRPLAKRPELSFQTILNGSFMENFEKFSADQFPLREKFRSVKTAFNMFVLGRLDNNGLFVTDGHISKLDDAENEYMQNYAADKFKSIYNTHLKDKNTNVYISIVPDKNYVLASQNGYPSLDYENFINKFINKVPYMKYIDILPLLSVDDYYTTDTHWKQEKITDIAGKIASSMGADIETEYKVNTLDNPFYGVYYGQLALPFKPDTIKYLTNDIINNAKVTYYDTGAPKNGDMYNMDKAYSKDPYEMFLSGVAPLITIENPDSESEKELVMFRDSFGSSLAPLMTQGYKKITVVDIRYMQSALIGNFVEFENSDVLFIYSTSILNNSLALR